MNLEHMGIVPAGRVSKRTVDAGYVGFTFYRGGGGAKRRALTLRRSSLATAAPYDVIAVRPTNER
jgi:hypothetical protein